MKRRIKNLKAQKVSVEIQRAVAEEQGESVEIQRRAFEAQRKKMQPDLAELHRRLEKNGVSQAVWTLLRGAS